MFRYLHLSILVSLLISLQSFSQQNESDFRQINQLIKDKDFFRASAVYDKSKKQLTETQQLFTEAILENAFNKLASSNEKISKLIAASSNLPDSLQLMLYKTREDNYVKLYAYEAARQTVGNLLKKFDQILDADDKKDLQNDLKIWTALKDVPPQKVVINGNTRLKMIKDKAGLNTLLTTVQNDTMSFIFDTGANMSTISASAAKQLKLQVIPANISVMAITGNEVIAQLAICDSMKLGEILIQNIVFLVLADEGLSFPQIDYHIQGILGFPVIEALKEIQISKDGYFVVPLQETQLTGPSNMAMFGLTPLICMDDMHFSFDTGAESTMLYANFYFKNRKTIDGNYRPVRIGLGGAGGKVEVDGFKINHTFHILNKSVKLKQISLLKQNLPPIGVYGNIGQDVIRQFDKMTLNFDKMFIRFD